MAKFCTECGHALTEETTVCPECGTRVQNSANPSPEKKTEAQKAIPTENRQAEEVCPQCGTPYRPGVQFCTECGTRRAQSPAETNQTPVNPKPARPTQPDPMRANSAPMGVPYSPAPANAASIEDDMPRGGAYGVVSTGAFFWLDVLFKLPGLGWLFCIILSFAPKNYNIKHFARSRLVVLVIALICAGLLYAVFAIFGDQIAAALQSFVSDLLS